MIANWGLFLVLFVNNDELLQKAAQMKILLLLLPFRGLLMTDKVRSAKKRRGRNYNIQKVLEFPPMPPHKHLVLL